MPERRPRPLCARRSRRDRRATGGGLFARARRAPIPAPHANPPGALSYGDLLLSTFTPLRLPLTWPQFAADLDAAANGDAVDAEDRSAALAVAAGVRRVDDVGGDLVRRRSRPAAVVGRGRWPSDRFTDVSKLWGPVLGWWLWAPCASNWPAHATDRYTGPVERQDQDPDPADQRPVRPRHRLPQRAGRRAAARQRRAAHPRRLGPPELPDPQHVHRRGENALPRRSRHPTARHASANPTRSRSLNCRDLTWPPARGDTPS